MKYKVIKSDNKGQTNFFKDILNREFTTRVPMRYNHIRAEIDGHVYFIPSENLEITPEDGARDND